VLSFIEYAYAVTLLPLCGYSAYRLSLVIRFFLVKLQSKRFLCANKETLAAAELPPVLVQLPIYNEPTVIARLIDCVANFDYPKELFEIQILDDSSDHTPEIVSAAIHKYRERYPELQINHLRRGSREGYKAGALAYGLKQSSQPYIAIFDADFMPKPDFLKRMLREFTSPKIAAVQAKWSFANERTSILTRAQAILLSGHFEIEHRVRSDFDLFMNFNGSGGMWLRSAIDDAGGWEGDTITEDLDLSYRTQLRGWGCKYVPDYEVPSELPESFDSFKLQQHRWAVGGIQVFKKLAKRLFIAEVPLGVRLEALFHLGAGFCYPFVVLLGLLSLPANVIALNRGFEHSFLSVVNIFGVVLGVGVVTSFYAVAYHAHLRRSPLLSLILSPLAVALGFALSLSNSIAVGEALFGGAQTFRRTPKHRGNSFRSRPWLRGVEIALACYWLLTFVVLLVANEVVVVPLLLSFLLTGGLMLYWNSVPLVHRAQQAELLHR